MPIVGRDLAPVIDFDQPSVFTAPARRPHRALRPTPAFMEGAANVNAYNPAFDVTPARYISAIITEQGVLRPPLGEAIAEIIAPLHGHTLRSEPIIEKRKVKA